MMKPGMGMGEPYTPIVDRWITTLAPAWLVDIGCGTGKITRFLQAPNVLGVDLCEADLEKASAFGVDVLHADVLEFLEEQSEGSYDVVTGFDIIEHMEKEKGMATLDEAWRVAGQAFILGIPIEPTLPTDGNPDAPLQTHRSIWSVDELLAWGFDRVLLVKDYHFRPGYNDGKRFDAALCLRAKDKSKLDALINAEVI
jgi:SAM-dependent methyltransferase